MRGFDRVLCWFSCGDASAAASKLAVEKYGDRCEVLYCDTSRSEHIDNMRFLRDVEAWLGVPIKILRNPEYLDIYEVFQKTRYLVGPKGARCTTELKKGVRKRYQRVDDLHIFGFTVEEGARISRFKFENPELLAEFPLFVEGIDKRSCHRMVREAGIELPMMYRLGYKNNNCIGCVKGAAGYWNKIRKDFPEVFWRMAGIERQLDVAINARRVGKERVRIFLDELPEKMGRYKDEGDIECGVLCSSTTD